MKLLLVVAVALIVGCGTSMPVPQYAGIIESQYVENRELPPRPDAEAIPADKDWVKPLPAAQCTYKDKGGSDKVVKTRAGVLISPEKGVRAALWKTGYEGLRTLYDLDRKVWTEHRTVYDERLAQANKEIERRSPSWWDNHKTSISWAAGFTAGAAATILIVYSVNEVK